MREDVYWDIKNIFPANEIRTLNVREFDLLEPQDFKVRAFTVPGWLRRALIPSGPRDVVALQRLVFHRPRGEELPSLLCSAHHHLVPSHRAARLVRASSDLLLLQ